MLTDDEIDVILAKAPLDDDGYNSHTFARAIIAAYQEKLLDGVEMPERFPAGYIAGTEYFMQYDEGVQYGDARDQAGYLRGLETALLKVTGLSVDVERCKQLQLTTQAWEEALDVAAAAIEKLREVRDEDHCRMDLGASIGVLGTDVTFLADVFLEYQMTKQVLQQMVDALNIGIAKHYDLAEDVRIGDAIAAGQKLLKELR